MVDCNILYATGDEIRRVVMESVIPFVGEIRASRVERSKYKGRKVIPDATLAEYDQFDDYLEMVVQFGVSVKCLHLLASCELL